jgi:hypothetical protein
VWGTLLADDEEYAIDVSPGPKSNWVQIGCPRRSVDVPWLINGGSGLMVHSEGETKGLAEAKAAGWCEDFAWGYDPDSGYQLVYDPTVCDVGTWDHLSPGQGYWFLAHRPCQLLILPASALSAAKHAHPPARPQPGDWRFPLLISADSGLRSQAVLGRAQTPLQIEGPPPFGRYVQLRVVEGDSRLAVDLREAEQAPGWVVEAKTNMPTARVTLTWPDLSQMPRDSRPVLVDPETGTRRYMRTTSSYSCTSGKEGALAASGSRWRAKARVRWP